MTSPEMLPSHNCGAILLCIYSSFLYIYTVCVYIFPSLSCFVGKVDKLHKE